MKKFLVIFLICILTGCTKKITPQSPNELLLGIKDYSCKMQISYFSNKNSTEYLAIQSYSSLGKYSMEFLDNDNLKINYENSNLNITSNLANTSINLSNYKELNKNPLFLSYFINTYFNTEIKNNIKIFDDSIHLILPTNNQYLYSAELLFKDNVPYSLSYFDENGNVKVNIIYNEFTLIA